MSTPTHTYPFGIRFLAGVAITLCASMAAANPPPVHTEQVPGFFRVAIGDATVTALYDGYVHLDPNLLKGRSQKEVQTLLANMFLENDQGMQTAVNGYLVHTGDNLVLIDVGAGNCFGPTVGNIQDALGAAGYQPADVDTILITHMHADHVCGLTTEDGKAVFPNATVWAAKTEADYWLNKQIAQQAPEQARSFFERAQRAVAPYQSDDRFMTFNTGTAMDPDTSVVPGLTVVPTHGHTPGHASFLLQSGNAKLLIWGDIVHAHAVQLPYPEVSIEFDVDAAQAIKARAAILEDAVDNRWMVAGAHMPFPGLGHIRPEDRGYSWVPVSYAPLDANP